MAAQRNLMVIQGGGPTQVFNASLHGIVVEAAQGGFARVLGARHGMKGLANAEVLDLLRMDDADLVALRNTPGAAMGSSRFSPSAEDTQRSVGCLKEFGVTDMIFMGGNGTMRGAEMFASSCEQAGLDVRVMGVPKTVDNDIAVTDRCPGYASAARFVAQSTHELGLDLRSLPQPVTVFETMGRDVGWLAAASTMACVADRPCGAPHLVYVPEVAFDEARFLADLDRVLERKGWAVVVVSEGICKEDGTLVYSTASASQADPLRRPMTGGVGQHLAKVVAEMLGVRCRSEKPGLLGRASIAMTSQQDVDDALLVGRAAVRELMAGESGKMVALTALGADGPGYRLTPLAEVAGVERRIPREWLSGGPLAVTDEFRKYLQPLVGEMAMWTPEFPAAQKWGAEQA